MNKLNTEWKGQTRQASPELIESQLYSTQMVVNQLYETVVALQEQIDKLTNSESVLSKHLEAVDQDLNFLDEKQNKTKPVQTSYTRKRELKEFPDLR